MKIKSLTLQNFRCFGPTPTTIELDDLTAFVGSNGCGKSTVLQALTRLFGLTGAERTIKRGDFHVPRGTPLDNLESTDLLIEARIEFPKVSGVNEPGGAVAECFWQMIVEEPDAAPYCRVRLEGHWKPGNLPEGSIDQELCWIKTASANVLPNHKQKMQAHERSRIHVHYIPATRDPLRQIRLASGSIMHRLFRAVNWSSDVIRRVEQASSDLSAAFRAEAGVEVIRKALTRYWRALHSSPIYSDVHVRPLSQRFNDLLAQVEAVFSPAPEESEHGIERLSDGLKSLFYLTLIGTIFDIERTTVPDVVPTGGDPAPRGISQKDLQAPSLTILAVEEPENHLAPHYLGRIMKLLRKMATSPTGQVLISSHSASIMRRVEPEQVRYIRLHPNSHESVVKPIDLPPEDSEAHKFVRQAVLAYPELYFARVVILGEGDSEEIVLPRVAESLELSIDTSFVSIVPLGGRHVNHFWRLLKGLDIPYVTLLDLDRERDGGGWGRIKYVAKQLIKLGVPREDFLTTHDGNGEEVVFSDQELEGMHEWDVTNTESMNSWIEKHEDFGVYFSTPLDLDFMMYLAFPENYRATGDRGPRIPKADDSNRDNAVKEAIAAVLKQGTDGGTYTDDEKEAFFWYRYLFLGRGKPSTHLLALTTITDKDLGAKCPKPLQRLVAKVKEHLGEKETQDAANAQA